MTRFEIVIGAMVALLLVGGLFGGLWIWAALIQATLLTAIVDQLAAASPKKPDTEFPAGTGLLQSLGYVHPVLLTLAILAVTGRTGLPLAERCAAFVAFSLYFGQIAHPAAHELIHRSSRILRGLGIAIYSTLGFGHHASAHLLVHHVHVGRAEDPNSPPLGRNFYRFFAKAWKASFIKGLQAETARRSRAGKRGIHPYAVYVGGFAATFLLALLIASAQGALIYCGICFYTQIQILMADYVQHYGLRRHSGADGRVEPVGPNHSWNSPHWMSSALMLNAPRHSDHHLNPSRDHRNLELDPETMPILPYSLPIMALLALWPGRWRALMDPLARRWSWQSGDSPAGDSS